MDLSAHEGRDGDFYAGNFYGGVSADVPLRFLVKVEDGAGELVGPGGGGKR